MKNFLQWAFEKNEHKPTKISRRGAVAFTFIVTAFLLGDGIIANGIGLFGLFCLAIGAYLGDTE